MSHMSIGACLIPGVEQLVVVRNGTSLSLGGRIKALWIQSMERISAYLAFVDTIVLPITSHQEFCESEFAKRLFKNPTIVVAFPSKQKPQIIFGEHLKEQKKFFRYYFTFRFQSEEDSSAFRLFETLLLPQAKYRINDQILTDEKGTCHYDVCATPTAFQPNDCFRSMQEDLKIFQRKFVSFTALEEQLQNNEERDYSPAIQDESQRDASSSYEENHSSEEDFKEQRKEAFRLLDNLDSLERSFTEGELDLPTISNKGKSTPRPPPPSPASTSSRTPISPLERKIPQSVFSEALHRPLLKPSNRRAHKEGEE